MTAAPFASASQPGVDPESGTPPLGVNVAVDDAPIAIVVSPDQSFAYTISAQEGTVTVVDLVHKKLSKLIPVGNGSDSGAFSSSGAVLYVLNVFDGSVCLIDPVTQSATATVPLPSTANAANGLGGVGTSESGDDLLVFTASGNLAAPGDTVFTCDVTTGAVTAVKVNPAPITAALAAHDTAVVGSALNETVAIINYEQATLTDSLRRTDNSPTVNAAVAPNLHLVALAGEAATTWLDVDTLEFQGSLPAPGKMVFTGAAFTTDGRYTVMTAQHGDGNLPGLLVVADGTYAQVSQFDVVVNPSAVACTPDFVLVTGGPNPKTGKYVLSIIDNTDVLPPDA